MREGRAPVLYDVRERPSGWTLRGALPWPGDDWRPSTEGDVLLVDDDGSIAVPKVEALQELGFERVRALFGGLELYAFSLDPSTLSEETFLERISPSERSIDE